MCKTICKSLFTINNNLHTGIYVFVARTTELKRTPFSFAFELLRMLGFLIVLFVVIDLSACWKLFLLITSYVVCFCCSTWIERLNDGNMVGVFTLMMNFGIRLISIRLVKVAWYDRSVGRVLGIDCRRTDGVSVVFSKADIRRWQTLVAFGENSFKERNSWHTSLQTSNNVWVFVESLHYWVQTLVDEEINLRRCFSIDEDLAVRGWLGKRGDGLSLWDAVAVFAVSNCAGLLFRFIDETVDLVDATAVVVVELSL